MVSRFLSSLIVPRFVLSDVKYVGLLKCLLNELAMYLMEVMMILLNSVEWLGSVVVGKVYEFHKKHRY